jgi:hypothetical protein
VRIGIRHLIFYVLLFVAVNLVDAATTILFVSLEIGEEINPLVDTSSLFSILFSPLQIVYAFFCIGTVSLAENFPVGTAKAIRRSQFLLFLCSLPYFYLISKIIATINNMVLLMGFHEPISFYFQLFGNSAYIGMLIAYVVFAAVFLPLCERYLKSRYKVE